MQRKRTREEKEEIQNQTIHSESVANDDHWNFMAHDFAMLAAHLEEKQKSSSILSEQEQGLAEQESSISVEELNQLNEYLQSSQQQIDEERKKKIRVDQREALQMELKNKLTDFHEQHKEINLTFPLPEDDEDFTRELRRKAKADEFNPGRPFKIRMKSAKDAQDCSNLLKNSRVYENLFPNYTINYKQEHEEGQSQKQAFVHFTPIYYMDNREILLKILAENFKVKNSDIIPDNKASIAKKYDESSEVYKSEWKYEGGNYIRVNLRKIEMDKNVSLAFYNNISKFFSATLSPYPEMRIQMLNQNKFLIYGKMPVQENNDEAIEKLKAAIQQRNYNVKITYHPPEISYSAEASNLIANINHVAQQVSDNQPISNETQKVLLEMHEDVISPNTNQLKKIQPVKRYVPATQNMQKIIQQLQPQNNTQSEIRSAIARISTAGLLKPPIPASQLKKEADDVVNGNKLTK